MKKIAGFIVLLLGIQTLSAISIKDYIKQYGQPKVVNGRLELDSKDITSLDGLNQIKNPGTITSIYLSNNEITTIPADAFSQFKNLKTLFLRNNHINDVNPSAFKGLVNLEDLWLSKNELTYTPNINLPKLKHLGLSQNKIAMIGDSLKLPALNKISFWDNQISSISKNAFKSMPNLENLELNQNKITSLDPATLANNKRIKIVGLRDNPLTKTPEQIRQDLKLSSEVSIITIKNPGSTRFRNKKQ